MRDRLIELLFQANDIVHRNGFKFNANVMADHLLANGVIVPPCKVGDTVYSIDYYYDCDIDGYEVCDEYQNDESSCEYCPHNVRKNYTSEIEFKISFYDDFGKTVFLTKEEAERALKEREQG